MKITYNNFEDSPATFSEWFTKDNDGNWISHFNFYESSYNKIAAQLMKNYPSIIFKDYIEDNKWDRSPSDLEFIYFSFDDEAEEAEFIIYQDSIEVNL
jgi:hypothetical protein